MQAVDRAADVGAVALAPQQARRRRRVELAPERLDVPPEARGHPLDEVGVAETAEVVGRADHPLAGRSVREERRRPQRLVENRPLDSGVAVGAHHLAHVEQLPGEVRVGVPEAVAPGQQQVLDQQVALGVVDALLRDDELRSGLQALGPVVLDARPRVRVGHLVHLDRPRPARPVEPGEVDLPRPAHGRDERVTVEAQVLAEEQARAPPVPQLVPDPVQAYRRREADARGAGTGPARVDRQADEADQRASLRDPRRERLLPVADAVGVGIGGLEDRQVALGEARRLEPAQAGAVPLLAARADEDGQLRAVDTPRDDLAPVGHVQLHDARAAPAARPAEGQVVDPRVGQAPGLQPGGLANHHQRVQEAVNAVVGRPGRRGQQRVPPGVLTLRERLQDAGVVGRIGRQRHAGRGVAPAARAGAGHACEHDDGRAERHPAPEGFGCHGADLDASSGRGHPPTGCLEPHRRYPGPRNSRS